MSFSQIKEGNTTAENRLVEKQTGHEHTLWQDKPLARVPSKSFQSCVGTKKKKDSVSRMIRIMFVSLRVVVARLPEKAEEKETEKATT